MLFLTIYGWQLAMIATVGLIILGVLVAILVGGASGLAATGTNQIYKQLTKDKDDPGNDKTE